MLSSATKPTLILLGGALYDFPIRREQWHLIVAADSGAAHALRQDVMPDYVVGDFDSLPTVQYERLVAMGVPTKRLPVAKDLTDGEAAVDWAIQHGANRLVLAGGLGDRFDHSLGNILLLHRVQAAGATGWVTDGRQRVYLLTGELYLDGEPGDWLSIIPLSATLQGVTASGVLWPLSGATLHLGAARSLSNQLTDSSVRLAIEEGLALVVVTSRKLV